jgi:uncharacterized membrane protein
LSRVRINHKTIVRIALFFFIAIWFLGIISPCFNFNFTNASYPFQKQIYSTVCHQNIDKSFTCNDLPLLVCARCSGIYAGALLIAFTLIVYSKEFIVRTKYLILLSAPMLLDVILLNIGIYEYNKSVSAFTGFLFGSTVFVYILNAVENLLYSKQKTNNEF